MSPRNAPTPAWLPLLAVALLAIACAAEEAGEPGGSGDAVASVDDAGPAAPDFTLQDLDGNTVTLSEFRGKTVIVDFWATWCPPCVFQVPELNRLHSAHRDAGDVVVIGVSVDTDGVEVVKPWIEEQGAEYTIVMGDVELAESFGALGFPTLVVVNPEGKVDSLHVGLIEYDTLEELVATSAGA